MRLKFFGHVMQKMVIHCKKICTLENQNGGPRQVNIGERIELDLVSLYKLMKEHNNRQLLHHNGISQGTEFEEHDFIWHSKKKQAFLTRQHATQ